jgi:hypothetical protein
MDHPLGAVRKQDTDTSSFSNTSRKQAARKLCTSSIGFAEGEIKIWPYNEGLTGHVSTKGQRFGNARRQSVEIHPTRDAPRLTGG